MRIAVVSTPRSGNHWIKCLLGEAYELRTLAGRDKPDRNNARGVRRWVDDGRFADGTILHQHARYRRRLADAFEAVPARIVTIVRDPYDAFVSLYHWAQVRGAEPGRSDQPRARDVLVDRPIDDPVVHRYLAGDRFADFIERGLSWVESGRSVVVRYEELHVDPLGALRALTDEIEPVPDEKLVRAIDHCSVTNMRATTRPGRVRAGRVGDGAVELGPEHLALIREHHADRIRRLGYEVR